tara:strand:- start:2339 stop:2989 length:651 start_codon:yes stop_codon:yes gene_type:complete
MLARINRDIVKGVVLPVSCKLVIFFSSPTTNPRSFYADRSGDDRRQPEFIKISLSTITRPIPALAWTNRSAREYELPAKVPIEGDNNCVRPYQSPAAHRHIPLLPCPDMHVSNHLVVVVTTVESLDDAERLSRQLVEQSLAACVQIDGPITSHYRWDGAIQRSTEFRLTIKTSSERWPHLKERLTSLHPYDEPGILMLPVTDTTQGYLDWVVKHTV